VQLQFTGDSASVFFVQNSQGGLRIGKKYRISKMDVKGVGKSISEGFKVIG